MINNFVPGALRYKGGRHSLVREPYSGKRMSPRQTPPLLQHHLFKALRNLCLQLGAILFERDLLAIGPAATHLEGKAKKG